ncbi:hypothetical protein [Burkholderia gladioli]|uniref:hypothetical protein n=1 Tax=Burkholderia gladioli TaxID=28095 RepID=UPI00264C172E|nr:hypothetical protein [Burkholderia gladioli]MDN7720005.1 hypothetical protein [Burkholderia gladioli]
MIPNTAMNLFISRLIPTSTIVSNALSASSSIPCPDPAQNGQATQSELLLPQTDEQKFKHLFAELESALKSLDKAEAQSRAAREKLKGLQDTLDDRSTWDAFKGAFNGQTDKELAENVQVLGQSMELTQKVVRVMLKVQTQKGRLLNAFNDALVDKITKIQADTHTLDGNQRAAALTFLGELQQQVQEQIRRQNLIEQHDDTLQDLIQWKFEKGNEDAALTELLEQQQTRREQWQDQKDTLDARTEHQLQTLESETATLKQAVIDLDQWRQARHKADDDLSTHIAEAKQQSAQQLTRISDSIVTIAATQSTQERLALTIHARVDDLQTRVTTLERVQAQRKSLPAVLMHHGMSLLALGVAVAALIKSLCV